MFRAISRKPMPDAQAVRISAQVVFVIVRLTPKETLTQKLWGTKFDRARCWLRQLVRFFYRIENRQCPCAESHENVHVEGAAEYSNESPAGRN